jgi:phosphatidylglycerophosphate synthase
MVLMVQTGPLVGLGAQVLVLAAFGATTGIGVDGLAAGLAYGVVVWLGLSWGLRRRGAPGLGPADGVTMIRAALVGGVLALSVHSLRATVPTAVLVATIALALALDAVDGAVARHTGTASPLGGRFDMEIDAFLILVLSVIVARQLGAWVVAIGAMRYAFWVAGRLVPWLSAPVPPRYWRKVVAATQGIVLTAVTSKLFPSWLEITAVAVALALLVESFGHDVVWQWQARHRSPQRNPTLGGARR